MPVNVGATGLKFAQSITAPFCCASSNLKNCLVDFLLPKSVTSLSYSAFMFCRKVGFCSGLNKLPATVTLRLASSTCTTPSSYCGAIFTAVCIRDVVAPPIINGRVMPRRFISCATCTISSSDGVIKPLSPMMSTFSLTAVSKILSVDTITPRSMIS